MKRKIICTAVALLLASVTVSAQDYIYGDVNNSGYLEASDAAEVLQKALDKSYKMPVEKLYPDDYMKIADVNKSNDIEASDAAAILQKVLDSSYVMPVEKVENGSEATTETTTETTTEAVTYESDIVLADNNIKVNGLSESNGGVSIDNELNTVTITNGGSYSISGSLSDGQLIVDSDTDVELNLNGVSISNSKGAAIYGLNGDIDISAKKGTENVLSDGTPATVDEDGEPDACIYSSDDLKLKGTGKLTINGNYANGISGKDSVTVQKLNLVVNAETNAIKAKDLLTITSGTLELNGKNGDGIRCTKGDVIINDGSITSIGRDNGIFAKAGNIIVNGGSVVAKATDTKANLDTDTYNYDGLHSKVGDVEINGGSVSVEAYCDGIQAENNVKISGASTVNVTTTGTITTTTSGGFGGWGMNQSADISAKGIKAGTNLEISEATVVVDSTDDSIHSNGNVTIDNANIDVKSGDDGIHADSVLTINGDNTVITVSKCYEGIEGESIYINGGDIHIYADDDSINGAGGNDSSSGGGFGNNADGYIEINGGYIYIENTKDGDGIDSNGKIIFNGGTMLINGPTSSDNGAIDYGDKSSDYMAYNGGTIIAVGSSGMAAYPSASYSSGNTVVYGSSSSNNGGNKGGWGGFGNFGGNSSSSSTSISAGDVLTLADSDGNVVVAFKPVNSVQSVVISSDDIKSGETYTLYKNGTYSGSFNSDGYAYGGTVTGGTSIAKGKISSKLTKIS